MSGDIADTFSSEKVPRSSLAYTRGCRTRHKVDGAYATMPTDFKLHL